MRRNCVPLFRRLRSAIAVVLIVGSIGACTSPLPAANNVGETSEYIEISYVGASPLVGLNEFDEADQVRDWARFGLATHLGLDTAQLRDNLYDTLPVRDAAFADLARQPTGPGRALFDGDGVLHILVPRTDPHRSRTIGLQLDQYRTDAGTDPEHVRVYEYDLDRAARKIRLAPRDQATAADVRADNGYFTARVDQLDGLTDFLARSRHLSRVERRGQETWAGGWAWPEESGASLDLADVWALQLSYEDGDLPWFSLDPPKDGTPVPLRAVIPDARPELVDRILTKDWPGSGFESEMDLAATVDKALGEKPPSAIAAEHGLPTNRSQLWSLSRALEGQPTYSEAHYGGAIRGTEVGMTLGYVDHVAKTWVAGAGEGTPPREVEGFVPNSEAKTPWGHCDATAVPETGRLWFGQRESGFAFTDDGVSLGARATQLFSRTKDSTGGEIESSFSFARGLRWWDNHYDAIADYEPQYRRLEQIMRWSGALEWLTSEGATLPHATQVRSDLRLQDWMAEHDELRERDFEFVTIPRSEHEALRATPSAGFQDCGRTLFYGGVSLADTLAQRGNGNFRADVPKSVARAGVFDSQSRFDPATESGRIVQWKLHEGKPVNPVERSISRTPDGHAAVDVVAGRSKAASFGELKDATGAVGQRKLRTELSAENGTLRHRLDYQGEPLGELVATKTSTAEVVLWWSRGLVARVRDTLQSVQRGQSGKPAPQDVLYGVALPDGQILQRVSGPGDRWLSTDATRPPKNGIAFRFGYESRPDRPVFGYGTLVAPPRPASQWMTLDSSSGLPLVRSAPNPRPETAVTVTTADGRRATLHDDGNVTVATADPVLGLNGTVEGAALFRNFATSVQPVMQTMRNTQDPYYRGVVLGPDAAVLIYKDRLVLIGSRDREYALVARATGTKPGRSPPVFEFEGSEIRHVAMIGDDVHREVLEKSEDLGVALGRHVGTGEQVYAHSSLSEIVPAENGRLIPEKAPPGTKVAVYAVPRSALAPAEVATLQSAPDLVFHRGTWWYPFTPRERRFDPNGGGKPTGPDIPPVLLICPADDDSDNDDEHTGCES